MIAYLCVLLSFLSLENIIDLVDILLENSDLVLG